MTQTRYAAIDQTILDTLILAEKLVNEKTATWLTKRAQCTNDGDEGSADMYEKRRFKASSITMKIRALIAECDG